ncbi:DNA polymerase III subunit delta [Nakamurella deserti]|uniref:DNA polymerase III subunit delta n=1 Tax=Nakamurella deserti TaxID=2164074 RepID=UPI000DBE5D9A|nr:DNA polymerase III subunit delta [Nakamurella deserti]
MAPNPSLVLVSGEESLLVDRAVTAAVHWVLKVEPEAERRESTVTDLTPMSFSDMVAPSLFAEPRVVVLRNAHEAGKEMAGAIVGYLTEPVDGVTLVVQHAGGARNKALTDALVKAGATVVACSRITKPAERSDFVRSEIRSAGGTTSPDAIAALIDAVGNDLRELAGAAHQLVSDTGGLVDEASVRRYHRGRAEVTGFTVADKAIAGDVAGALEAARWATQVGVAQVLVADALADGVRTVARVAGSGRVGSSYQLASQLGMPPWKIERAQSAARHWAPAGLAWAVAVTARLNGEVKGLAADPDYAIEKAILDIGRARRMR